MRRTCVALVLAVAGCGGAAPLTGPTLTDTLPPNAAPPGASPAIAEMFGSLDRTVSYALETNQAELPLNPLNASAYQAKIAMLREPGFAAGISANRYFAEASVRSRNGRDIPVVTIFAQASMRRDAEAAVAELVRVLPLLESFLESDYPHAFVRVWYGFMVGSRGGNGELFTVDLQTFNANPRGVSLPYDAMLAHEHAHSYVRCEALTQFLELYAYNMLHAGSASVPAWIETRGYVPYAASNINAAALLDIYQWIGPETMAAGYRAILPLRPPYGSPLTDAMKQAFASAVPAEFRQQVIDKLSAIRF